jgi:hypothetical protein
MRLLLSMALAVSVVVAAMLMTPVLSTNANAAPLCRAPGVPKGCIPHAAAGSSSGTSNSNSGPPKGIIIVPAPPGGRPIGHCMECIAPHYAAAP